MERDKAGKNGERLTAEFLRSKGCTVIKMNYHSRFGEIDIIAETREYIIFTRGKDPRRGKYDFACRGGGRAQAPKTYFNGGGFFKQVETDLQPRFDVAEVTYKTRTDGSTGYSLNYIKNAF